ncbi:RNA-directed DNA polymerase, eukaryota, reverse transcriptase zinc-binding domain protein [Tanacetum coccineum]
MHGVNRGRLLVSNYNLVWCNIIKSAEDLRNKGIDLMAFYSKRVGNGSNVEFWNDIWFGDVAFGYRFHKIYALENQNDISVAEKMSQAGWNSSFRRIHRGSIELSQWEELCGILGSVILSSAEDRWRWTKLGSSEFTVASARSFIDDYILPNTNTPTRWSPLVPIKVNVLAWRLASNKLAARVNLYNSGIEVNSILCGVCDKCMESTDHLFFGCELAKELMVEVGRWDCLEVVFLTLWWHVWNFRNARLFAKKKPTRSLCMDSIVTYALLWINDRSGNQKDGAFYFCLLLSGQDYEDGLL